MSLKSIYDQGKDFKKLAITQSKTSQNFALHKSINSPKNKTTIINSIKL